MISRNVGPGTSRLERLQPGDTLNLSGPLGNGFVIPEERVPLVLVGGGVGIPPLLYLARRLDELGHRDVVVVLGATTRELLPIRLTSEPASDGRPTPCAELAGSTRFPTLITTNDGSLGLCGLVTDGLQRWYGLRERAPSRAVVFACGPDAMLRAVARLTRKLKLDCQLCVERRMGCGFGTCLSCVVRVTDATREAGWRWAMACYDGPVFQRDMLLDYLPADTV